MKKSFMTRALATGLSLAMAFSLTAATNVTTAAAAAKPAMKASQMTVKEGKSKTFLATAKTLKTYKITKAKVKNASAKQYISVKKNAKGTGIVVTGKKGADTARKIVITFQNKKTKKTTNLTTKVVVKAVPQEEEKLTMTASVTGVKTIVAEFNKAITSPAAVKVTVKKGASARDCKATVDGSKITIAMDTKLMAGTYTVSVEGVDTTAMTADVVVEKDETLTSFEVSPNLAMSSKTATDSAVCYYSALNQYGEPMVADKPDSSSSFSADTNVTRVATATVKGKIEIKKIPTVLAIQGTEGTIVLVDKNNGVNTSAKVKVSAAATASKVEIAGTYNTATSTMEAIKNGASLGNYYILFTAEDQYGEAVSVDDFAPVANIALAGGLTNVKLYNEQSISNSLTSIAVDGKEYIAIKLANGIAHTGTYTMTIVNTTKGLLSTGTYDVIDNVVVKSVSISPKNGAYKDAENEMEYSIVDKDGKEITSYALLSSLVRFTADGTASSTMKWEKKADGTAKLIYTPVDVTVSGTSDTATTLGTQVVYANNNTSSDYIVKTFTFTVGKARKIMSVQGLAADTTTSVAVGQELKIAFDKIVYADQYSNKVTKDDTAIYNKKVTGPSIAANTTGCAVAIVTKDGAFATTATAGATEFIFKSAKAGTADVYLKYANDSRENYKDSTKGVVVASPDNYDYKFTVTATDTGNVAASSLKIDSVYGGYIVPVSGAAAHKLTTGDITVVGTIGGSKTQIPTNQYVIKSIKNNTFTDAEIKAGTDTKTATVTVQVTTWDAYNNATETELTADYKVSVADKKVYKITDGSATGLTDIVSTSAVTASALQDLFVYADQYKTGGNDKQSVTDILGAGKIATDVTYEVTVSNAPVNTYRITGTGTNGINVKFNTAGNYTLKVKATLNGASKERTVTLTVK